MFLTTEFPRGVKLENVEDLELFAELLARFTGQLSPYYDEEETFEEIRLTLMELPGGDWPKWVGAMDLDGLAARINGLNKAPGAVN